MERAVKIRSHISPPTPTRELKTLARLLGVGVGALSTPVRRAPSVCQELETERVMNKTEPGPCPHGDCSVDSILTNSDAEPSMR